MDEWKVKTLIKILSKMTNQEAIIQQIFFAELKEQIRFERLASSEREETNE